MTPDWQEADSETKEEEETVEILDDDSWENINRSQKGGWWREYIPGGEEHVLVWESKVLGQLHKGNSFFFF